MASNYTDHDTERARQAEHSSAGLPTQSLGAPVLAAQPVGAQAPGRNNLAALALIAVGVVMILSRLAPVHLEIEGGLVLLTIASCFLFFSFWKRIYGLLIPGCILAGLSVGVTFADVTGGAAVLWGLALGFLSILFVGRALFNQRSNWPIYPAVPLFAVGVLVLAANLPGLLAGGLVWLPLLLIGAGLYLGWGRRAHS
jgi:uncharacterized membrane protein